jgi:hypothetical protein
LLPLLFNTSYSQIGESRQELSHFDENIELDTINKLSRAIQQVQKGLDPEILSCWYSILEAESKALCPTEELKGSIAVIQNPELPMKFEFKSSKRAIPYVIEALENNLDSMPFATRLYFQKFEEIIQLKLQSYEGQN